jgi:hypothetical protein
MQTRQPLNTTLEIELAGSAISYGFGHQFFFFMIRASFKLQDCLVLSSPTWLKRMRFKRN